jgi:7,8-dihydro-6-hydroxymethylpterin-pyrophosphokinase
VYGAETRAGPTVIIPHPRLTQRRFVLEPWAEIAPDWRLPNGTRVADWLSQVRDQEVERLLPEAPFPSSFDPSNAR